MLTNNFQFVSISLGQTMRALLTACCCIAFAGITQAQSSSYDFVVPGVSGPRWVDTGLYLPANTLVRFTATGTVDVSAGWGTHPPEGTPRATCAAVLGYPAEERQQRPGWTNCYGLVARLTTDMTLPTPLSPEVRTRWTYPESDGYLGALHGGHLWLTVNDDNPGDNTGAFRVHLEVTTFPFKKLCDRCPFDVITIERVLGRPLPDPKSLQTLMVLDGEIIAINQAGGTTLLTVSQGSVLEKYGDLPNMKIVFEKGGGRPRSSLSKGSVIQGVVFQNNKMSVITGVSRLSGRKAARKNQ